MTKYKEYVQKMIENNQELFNSFRVIHDKYTLDEVKWQEEFNKEGDKVLVKVREWENRLCSQSEKAGYYSFTTKLSEKFRGELKKTFPLIDHIGIKIKKAPEFKFKKIKLL